MEEFIQELILQHDLYDADVIVFNHGKIVEKHTISNPNVPIVYEKDAMVRVASISKLLVALSIMQLQERNLLTIDDAIDNYYDYPIRNPYYPEIPITIKMILTHTSSLQDTDTLGIPYGESLKELFHPKGKYYTTDMFIVHQDKRVVPGTFYRYYNTGFQLLAEIIEKLSVERFDRYIKHHILDLLEMKGSFNPFDDDIKACLKPAYRKINHTWIPQVDHQIKPVSYHDYVLGTNGSLFSPQGGLRTNASELAKLMHCFMTHSPKIISSDSLNMMMSTHFYVHQSNTTDEFYRNNGLGFNVMEQSYSNHIIEDKAFTLVGHCGIAYGCLGVFFFDPKTNHGLIFITRGHGKPISAYHGRYSTYFNFQEEMLTYVDKHYWRAI